MAFKAVQFLGCVYGACSPRMTVLTHLEGGLQRFKYAALALRAGPARRNVAGYASMHPHLFGRDRAVQVFCRYQLLVAAAGEACGGLNLQCRKDAEQDGSGENHFKEHAC